MIYIWTIEAPPTPFPANYSHRLQFLAFLLFLVGNGDKDKERLEELMSASVDRKNSSSPPPRRHHHSSLALSYRHNVRRSSSSLTSVNILGSLVFLNFEIDLDQTNHWTCCVKHRVTDVLSRSNLLASKIETREHYPGVRTELHGEMFQITELTVFHRDLL